MNTDVCFTNIIPFRLQNEKSLNWNVKCSTSLIQTQLRLESLSFFDFYWLHGTCAHFFSVSMVLGAATANIYSLTTIYVCLCVMHATFRWFTCFIQVAFLFFLSLFPCIYLFPFILGLLWFIDFTFGFLPCFNFICSSFTIVPQTYASVLSSFLVKYRIFSVFFMF